MKQQLVVLLAITAGNAAADEFHGYLCAEEDCADHRAGYVWAEGQKLTDKSACSGTSQALVEGCQAYVEEHYPAKLDDGAGSESDTSAPGFHEE